jgi:hypothetical protein
MMAEMKTVVWITSILDVGDKSRKCPGGGGKVFLLEATSMGKSSPGGKEQLKCGKERVDWGRTELMLETRGALQTTIQAIRSRPAVQTRGRVVSGEPSRR